MSSKQNRYAPELRRQMVELVRTGRSPAELAREFGPSAWTIALWVKQAARDVGKGDGVLTTAERQELTRLRRENRRLREERASRIEQGSLERRDQRGWRHHTPEMRAQRHCLGNACVG